MQRGSIVGSGRLAGGLRLAFTIVGERLMVGAAWSGIGGIKIKSAYPNFVTLYFTKYIRIKKACASTPSLPNLLRKKTHENVVMCNT